MAGTSSPTLTAWVVWCSNDSATATVSVSTDYIWPKWCSSVTSATTSVTATSVNVTSNAWLFWAGHEAKLGDVRERLEEQRRALERAEALLQMLLDGEQQKQFTKDRTFEVIGSQSKRRYRIRHGIHGNVRLLDEAGKEIASFCAQPHGVPDADAVLAQKLMLETAEDDFLKVANRRAIA